MYQESSGSIKNSAKILNWLPLHDVVLESGLGLPIHPFVLYHFTLRIPSATFLPCPAIRVLFLTCPRRHTIFFKVFPSHVSSSGYPCILKWLYEDDIIQLHLCSCVSTSLRRSKRLGFEKWWFEEDQPKSTMHASK